MQPHKGEAERGQPPSSSEVQFQQDPTPLHQLTGLTSNVRLPRDGLTSHDAPLCLHSLPWFLYLVLVLILCQKPRALMPGQNPNKQASPGHHTEVLGTSHSRPRPGVPRANLTRFLERQSHLIALNSKRHRRDGLAVSLMTYLTTSA